MLSFSIVLTFSSLLGSSFCFLWHVVCVHRIGPSTRAPPWSIPTFIVCTKYQMVYQAHIWIFWFQVLSLSEWKPEGEAQIWNVEEKGRHGQAVCDEDGKVKILSYRSILRSPEDCRRGQQTWDFMIVSVLLYRITNFLRLNIGKELWQLWIPMLDKILCIWAQNTLRKANSFYTTLIVEFTFPAGGGGWLDGWMKIYEN